MNMQKLLVYLVLKYNSNWDKVFNHISQKIQVDPKEVDKLVNQLKLNYITIVEDDFPTYLKRVNRPPFVLFYKGTNIPSEEQVNHLTGGSASYTII